MNGVQMPSNNCITFYKISKICFTIEKSGTKNFTTTREVFDSKLNKTVKIKNVTT